MKPSFLVEKKTNIKLISNSKNVNNEKIKLNQTKSKNDSTPTEPTCFVALIFTVGNSPFGCFFGGLAVVGRPEHRGRGS